MAIRGKIRGGSESPYKTGTYVGTQGNQHFFTAEGTGGDSSDSVTFTDPSSNKLQWGARFQKGKQYRYQVGNPNLPFE
jgi:hypothetical protein